MFRVFTEANGFALQAVRLTEAVYPSPELTSNPHVYDVVDPEQAGARVSLLSRTPVMMTVVARKLGDQGFCVRPPMQSDYVAGWQGSRPDGASPLRRKLKRLVGALPLRVRTRIIGYYQKRIYALSNRPFYRRLPEPFSELPRRRAAAGHRPS